MSLKDMVKKEDAGQLVETRYQMNKRRILEQRKRDEERRQTYLTMSISGDPKIGKSGIAMDCRTDKEIKEGWKVYCLDFDNGAKSTWQSQWDNDENIWIFNPWILTEDGQLSAIFSDGDGEKIQIDLQIKEPVEDEFEIDKFKAD